jgi:hypothetical protein
VRWSKIPFDMFVTITPNDIDTALPRVSSGLENVLHGLHETTGRWEASFASKLLATADPTAPVIDSVVLKNVGLRLPTSTSRDRGTRIVAVHRTLGAMLQEFLTTRNGVYLLERFRAAYPHADITAMKMLDLVLWQTRPRD